MRVFPAPALLHGAPSERDASVRNERTSKRESGALTEAAGLSWHTILILRVPG